MTFSEQSFTIPDDLEFYFSKTIHSDMIGAVYTTPEERVITKGTITRRQGKDEII